MATLRLHRGRTTWPDKGIGRHRSPAIVYAVALGHPAASVRIEQWGTCSTRKLPSIQGQGCPLSLPHLYYVTVPRRAPVELSLEFEKHVRRVLSKALAWGVCRLLWLSGSSAAPQGRRIYSYYVQRQQVVSQTLCNPLEYPSLLFVSLTKLAPNTQRKCG